MIPPHDVLAGLPAPLDDEPPSVRQDIADELADHLACAYRRELLKTADDRTAQQRVLDRFGNPQRIAYQLWFQALWGRIMLSRFARVWQGLKIVGGLVVLFLVLRMAEQQSALYSQIQQMTAGYNTMQSQAMGNRNLLEQLLSRLPAPPQPAGAEGMSGGMGMMGGDAGAMSAGMSPIATFGSEGGSMGMASAAMPDTGSLPATTLPGLTLRLTMEGDDNKPAVGCMVAVVDEENKVLTAASPHFATPSWGAMGSSPMASGMGVPGGMGMPATRTMRQLHPKIRNVGVELTSAHRGEVHFSVAEPGRYTAYVEFEDGHQCAHRFVIAPNMKARVVNILIPPAHKKAFVVLRTPKLPDELVEHQVSLRAYLVRQPDLVGKTDWRFAKDNSIWDVTFDSTTGLPIGYTASPITVGNDSSKPYVAMNNGAPVGTSLSGLAEEERFLSLSTGRYRVWLYWVTPDKTSVDSRYPLIPNIFEAVTPTNDGMLTVTPDMTIGILDVSPQMLEAAYAAVKRLAGDPPPEDEKKIPDDVLLNFTAPWCAPCRQMLPIVDKLREQGYRIRDVDVDRERGIAERFGVTEIPSFIQLADGEVVRRQTGVISEAQLLRLAK